MANETRTAGLVQEDVVRPEPIAIVGMGKSLFLVRERRVFEGFVLILELQSRLQMARGSA